MISPSLILSLAADAGADAGAWVVAALAAGAVLGAGLAAPPEHAASVVANTVMNRICPSLIVRSSLCSGEPGARPSFALLAVNRVGVDGVVGYASPPTINDTMRGWFSRVGRSSPTMRPRRMTTARSATSMT